MEQTRSNQEKSRDEAKNDGSTQAGIVVAENVPQEATASRLAAIASDLVSLLHQTNILLGRLSSLKASAEELSKIGPVLGSLTGSTSTSPPTPKPSGLGDES